MPEFTKVHCGISNGIVLQLYEESKGPFGVISYFEKSRVVLNGGDNEVATEFFDQWVEANSGNELVKNGFIERKN